MGKNIRGYSSFGIHLRFVHSASEQLADAEWKFKLSMYRHLNDQTRKG